MAWRGEPVCDFSELPPDECGHCTGAATRFDDSLKEPFSVDDPSMWEDDDDD